MTKKKGRKKRPKTPPIITMTMLLTASFSTLVGVCFSVEPFVILVRSTISAVCLGVAVSLGIQVVRLANSGRQQRDGAP